MFFFKKKTAAFLAASILLVSLAGCGEPEKEPYVSPDFHNESENNTKFDPNKENASVTDATFGDAELMYVEEYMGRVRAELRSPDASSNPYLIYALLIYAGLEGIANKQTLPEIMKEGAMLPASKKEAIKFANESDFIKKYLPEDLIKVYSM